MNLRALFHVLVANVSQQLTAFVGVVIVARLLLPQEFAVVRIAIAYAAVATILAGGGLTAPVLRYCADPKFDLLARRRLLGHALIRLSGFAAVTSAGALLLTILSGRTPTETLVFVAYALQIPALAATSLLMVYLQAIGRFRFLSYSQILIRLATTGISILGTLIWGLHGLLLATVLMVLVGVLPLYLAAKPSYVRSSSTPVDFALLARHSLIGMFISTIGQYVDLFLLDVAGADKQLVGSYSLATIFFLAAGSLVGAVQSVSTPHFTVLMTDRAAFHAALWRWSSWLTAAGVALGIAATAAGWLLEVFFLGRSYVGLSAIVAILMVRFLVWCAYAVSGAAMVGIGAIRQGTAVAAITTASAIVLGYPLVLLYGVWGAATSQTLVAIITAALVFRVTVVETRKLRSAPEPDADALIS